MLLLEVPSVKVSYVQEKLTEQMWQCKLHTYMCYYFRKLGLWVSLSIAPVSYHIHTWHQVSWNWESNNWYKSHPILGWGQISHFGLKVLLFHLSSGFRPCPKKKTLVLLLSEATQVTEPTPTTLTLGRTSLLLGASWTLIQSGNSPILHTAAREKYLASWSTVP